MLVVSYCVCICIPCLSDSRNGKPVSGRCSTWELIIVKKAGYRFLKQSKLNAVV